MAIQQGLLFVDFVILGLKHIQNKDESFTLAVRPEKNSPRVMLLHRCEVLSSYVKVMMKRLVTIRWNARHEAIRAVKTGLQGVIQALDSLTPASENLQVRGECTNHFAFC